ncbi:MAG: hypothetical protein WBA37_11825 [Xanthobacteraceae bacterium]
MAEPAQFDRAYNYCEIQIVRDADWIDSVVLQQLNADGTKGDLDFSGISRFDLYIRPVYDHTQLIKLLSSDPSISGEILFSPIVPGRITFYVTRNVIIANLPIGKWNHFLVAAYADGTTREFWRGDLLVHPGRLS